MAYNYSKKLRVLKYKTFFERIIEEWGKRPKLFKKDLHHYLTRPNTSDMIND